VRRGLTRIRPSRPEIVPAMSPSHAWPAWTREPSEHDNAPVTDRVSFLLSASAAVLCVLLLTGGIEAYLSGASIWWTAWAAMLQVATVWQVVRRFRRRRATRGDAG
jgi:hypothetical protein